MKIELVDIVVAVLAVFFLAAYFRLGTAAFLYVVVLLVLAEVVVLLRFKKEREVKQPESMP
ncbi:MAG: hypothetical protein J4400_01375 [Candidatus Aenigmarchaeota archaeon]|nr:hypothetical protein [Candidatus Aenigmarchaeota archaeon]